LLAVAVLGLVMSHTFNRALDRELATVQISAEVRQSVGNQRMKLAGMTIPADADAATQTALKHAVDGAFVAAFRQIMGIAALLALFSAIAAWFMIRDQA
jgi:hypothetical protein